jgi:hypothetical protein
LNPSQDHDHRSFRNLIVKVLNVVEAPLLGLAAVCVEWQKCGFINKAGDLVIEPKYRVTHSFREGLALAGFDYSLIGFVNKSGEMVIEPQFGAC